MTQNPKQIDAATAMMLAAEYVEQEDRFDFHTIEVPRTCDDVGCVLGWTGFVLGYDGDRLLSNTLRTLGYEDDLSGGSFYDEMTRVCGGHSWKEDATLAATGLRKLAQERMQ